MASLGDEPWKTKSIIVQCACGARFQSVIGHPLVRCATCSAVTDLRISHAPPPQLAPEHIDSKNKAPSLAIDDDSSSSASFEKAKHVEPVQPPILDKIPVEVDPEYASDDEAVKEAIRQGKYRRKIRARDVLLVMLLVLVAIGAVVAVVILAVKYSKDQDGSGKQPTPAIIAAAVLLLASVIGFGVQEWRFRNISHLTVVTELWSAFGYIFLQGAGFLLPFYIGLKQGYTSDTDHPWVIAVETVDCVLITFLYWLYLRFRLRRLPFYKYMWPPGTFCSWFAIVFAPQVVVWVGIGLWRNSVSSHHAVIFACAGVLWFVSIFVAALSNRGLFLTAACALASLTAFVWNISRPEALSAWIVVFVICAGLAHWPHASRPWICAVSCVLLCASLLFQALNRFKRPDIQDNSMPLFGNESVLRAQDAMFIANLLWIPAYIRDRDFTLPIVIAISVVFTSAVWASAFWGVVIVCMILWALFTRDVRWWFSRLLFVVLLGSWYAWGWLCNWESTRDRATVIAVAYALIVVGTLMDLRALEILPVGALRFMRGVFRPQPDAYTAIGFIVLEVPKDMLELLRPLHDVIIQVDTNTTDAIGSWLKDFLKPTSNRPVNLRVLSLDDHSLRDVQVPAYAYPNIKARSDYLGGICDSLCKVAAVTNGSPADEAGVKQGQLLFGPFSSDRTLRRALFGRRGFRIASYATSDPPAVFSKKRILVPKKSQEIKDDPYAVTGLTLVPSNAWSLPKKLSLTDGGQIAQPANKPIIPDSVFGRLFVNSNNHALGNWTLSWWIIATAVSVLAFKDAYPVFTFMLAVSYLFIGLLQAVWMRVIRSPRAEDVRSVIIVFTIISAALLWFIVGYRANPFTRHGSEHRLNVELWVIVSLFVGTPLISGWFQRGEKAWEMRGLWSDWLASAQEIASDEPKPEKSAKGERVFSAMVWCAIPFLLFTALLAVWPSPGGFEAMRWTPVLLLLVPCAYTLLTPALPYLASGAMIAVTSAFMLVIVALAPRVLLGVGDSYDQDSQNWRARLAYDLILAATVVIMIPLQLLRKTQPHPALIGAFCCIAMLTSYFSLLLLVVLLVLSALIIVLGAANEDSYMWAVFWCVPVIGGLRSVEFLFWDGGENWKFVWIGVIGVFLLVWCFTTFLLQAFTAMYKKEHILSAVCRCFLACGAAFLLLRWSHGYGTVAVLAILCIVFLVLPKNKMVYAWFIIPTLFFPAVWQIFDWQSDKWDESTLVPACVALVLAIMSSPLLRGLRLLRNTVKQNSKNMWMVHEWNCIIALVFGLLTFNVTKGALGIAIVVIIIIHAVVVRHLWWLFVAPGLVSLGVWLITEAIDSPTIIAAGIALATTAGLVLAFGVVLFRKHHWFVWHKQRIPEEIAKCRHSSGRYNPCIRFEELGFTIFLECILVCYFAAGTFMALVEVPGIACAITSGALLLLLAAKWACGAQEYQSLPSELYWVIIGGFAIASAFAHGKSYSIMPIVVCIAFGIACMINRYRIWILLYPAITAGMAAVASIGLREDTEYAAIAAGWGASVGAALCMLVRACSRWHHFGFVEAKEGEVSGRVASDAWMIHSSFKKKQEFYLTLEIMSAIAYVIGGIVIYAATDNARFGHRVGWALGLALIGVAHSVHGFLRHQKWRRYGGLALLAIACIFGAFIQNKVAFRLIFFSVMAVVVLFILLLFVYPIIRNWCRNVPDDDIEMGDASNNKLGIPELEKEHQIVPQPSVLPPPVAATSESHEMLIPTGIAIPLPAQPEKAATAPAVTADNLPGKLEESSQHRDEMEKEKQGLLAVAPAHPESEPVKAPELSVIIEPVPESSGVPIPVPAASPASPVTVDNSELQSVQKRMVEMEARLKKSEEEQRFLREKLELFMARQLASAAAPKYAASFPSAPAPAPAFPNKPTREVFYPPSQVPVRIFGDGVAKTSASCPYSSCGAKFEAIYGMNRDEYTPLRCPMCKERLSAPERLVQARKQMRREGANFYDPHA